SQADGNFGTKYDAADFREIDELSDTKRSDDEPRDVCRNAFNKNCRQEHICETNEECFGRSNSFRYAHDFKYRYKRCAKPCKDWSVLSQHCTECTDCHNNRQDSKPHITDCLYAVFQEINKSVGGFGSVH